MCLSYKCYHIFKRIPHKFLSYFDIRWEVSYLLTQEIVPSKLGEWKNQIFELVQKYNVRPLTYDDFLLGDKSNFTPSKLKIIKDRFINKEQYTAYGIVSNGQLIYSCWTYRKELILSYGIRLPMEEDVLFMDDYCLPEYRGQRIHTQMNFYRLEQLYNMKNKKVAVLVHVYNKPALRSQITAGFTIKNKILVFKIGEIRGYKIKKLK